MFRFQAPIVGAHLENSVKVGAQGGVGVGGEATK